MPAANRSSRGNPVWLLWLIWGLTFAFVGCAIAAWLWMQRPIDFEERDLYGAWMSEGPHPTTLEFKRGAIVKITGAPLPHPPEYTDCPLFGESAWSFFAGAQPRVVIGRVCGQSIGVENGFDAPVLVLYTGDPDQPESRVVFTRR